MRRLIRIMYVCLPLPCMCCDCLSRAITYVLLRKRNDSWWCDTHSIWNPFSGFVMEILLLCSGNGKHEFFTWPWQWKFSGSKSLLRRTLTTTQNPTSQIIHQTSPATERIWVLCSFSDCILQSNPNIQPNSKFARISAGIDFWTYIDWDLLLI
jgi:hypothetical protein